MTSVPLGDVANYCTFQFEDFERYSRYWNYNNAIRQRITVHVDIFMFAQYNDPHQHK